jgi:integrase
VSKDTACRPHELLKLRIKNIMFKTTAANHQYAEVLVNGKTGNIFKQSQMKHSLIEELTLSHQAYNPSLVQ